MRVLSLSPLLLLSVFVALIAYISVPVQADLPIHCLNAQIAGSWTFTLDKGGRKVGADGSMVAVSCGYPQPDKNVDHFTRPPKLKADSTYKVRLLEPNIVKDENGARGHWTMVYDEGFEVVVGNRRFFAFNKYVPNKGTSLDSRKVAHYTSHCDETMVGWWHDTKTDEWGCYQGKQTKALNTWTQPVTKWADDGITDAPVVSPHSLVEEFQRVLVRDQPKSTSTVMLEEEAEVEIRSEEEQEAILEQQAENETEAEADEQSESETEADEASVPHPHSHVASVLPEVDDSVLFEADLSFIDSHNRNPSRTWHAGVHKEFERKPVKEMMSLLGLGSYKKDFSSGVTGPKKFRQPIEDNRPDEVKYSGLPQNWDWTDRNGLNYDVEPRNQGRCGSCYAMAAISALESRFRVKSRLSYRPLLSTQNMVSCSFYNQGCQGGFPFLVAKHGAEFGLVDAECQPYTARNDDCPTSLQCKSQRVFLTNYTYVGGYMGGCSEVAMMREIYQNGPIMVAFQAPPDLFYYTGGIYTGPAPKEEAQNVNGVNVWQQTNHAAVAVGWGVDKKTGLKYWKLKNSWGVKWGQQGYFLIRRGTNECGIESMGVKADIVMPSSITIPSDAPNPYSEDLTAIKSSKPTSKLAKRRKNRKSKSNEALEA